MTATQAKKALKEYASPARAKALQRFFKTAKGEYGYGDIFIGVTVPQTRLVAKKFVELPLKEVKKLLSSRIHEERLLALIILVVQFAKASEEQKLKIFRIYLSLRKHINNWDLVDISAHKIIGPYLKTRNRAVLYELAVSKSIWDKRIAILATFHFIRNRDFADTTRLAKQYLNEEHDLMHKATGWMLREMGKVDLKALERFLKANYKAMPRTMLRYAIERLPERRRKAYLAGNV